MKTLLTTLCLLALLAGNSFATTKYVSDTLVVTVRAQPGNGEQILDTVRTGAPLEILEEQKDYFLVRTAKGIEGYIRSQYVSAELPKAQQIKQLQTANDQLQNKAAELSTRLNSSNKEAADLTSTAKELTRIKADYLALQKASANVLQITRERDQLQQENSNLTERMQQLKEENSLYLRTGVIKWFLAGAGVLFFGWILGKLSRKKKRNYL